MVCEDLAKQLDFPPGSGRKHNVRVWKQILVSGWEKQAHDLDSEVLPTIDGESFEIIFRRENRLAKQEMSEVIEFGFSYGADRGAQFREQRKRMAAE